MLHVLVNARRPAGLVRNGYETGVTRRLLTLIALLSLVLVAGCGGDDGGGGGGGGPTGGPAAIVAAAIKAGEDTESYRMAYKLKSDIEGQVFAMDGEGISAADSSRGRFKGEFTADGETFDMEFIAIGKDQWFRGGPFKDVIPKGKSWLHVNDPTAFNSTMTPSEFLEFLRESPEISEVGREDVRGQRSVHLRGPVDIVELVKKTDSRAAEQFSKIPRASEMDMVIDVWVAEDDDRMNRMKVRISHPSAKGSMEISGELLEYDVSLDSAEEPPADDVAEASDVGVG
jgi:hypothetical protein